MTRKGVPYARKRRNQRTTGNPGAPGEPSGRFSDQPSGRGSQTNPGGAPETNGASASEDLEAIKTELASVKEAYAQAISKYLEAARALNSTIPPDVIAGQTIEEIDASVQKAKAIANAVKANLEAQAKEAKVPAGAPTRGEISLEGLSPREKIAAGIQQKGGIS